MSPEEANNIMQVMSNKINQLTQQNIILESRVMTLSTALESMKQDESGDGGNYDFQVNANNTVNPLIYADADSGTYGRLGIGRTPGNHVVDVSGSMRINPLPAATVTATLNRNPGYPTIRSEGNNPANNWLILDSAGNGNRLGLNYFNNDDVVICHGGGGVGGGARVHPVRGSGLRREARARAGAL